jgi:outer membrane protein assembly factor BamB
VPALPAPLPAQGAAVGAAEFPGVAAPQAQPVEAWRIAAGRGFLGAPRVRAHVMIAAHTGRDVTVRETANGDTYWRRRFRTPITALTVADGVVYFAERARSGTVHAIALENADELWTARVRQARYAPIVLGELLVFGTDTGELVALERATGNERWRTPIGAVLAVPPVSVRGGIAAATTTDTLYQVGPDGSVTRRTALPATPSAPALVSGSTLVLPLHDRSVAFVSDEPAVRVTRLDDVVLAQPVHGAGEEIIVLTRAAQLVSVDDGIAAPIAALDGAATRSLARVANGFVVGLLDGTVMLIDETGTVQWRHETGASIDEPVAAEDGALYVATRRGALIKLVDE